MKSLSTGSTFAVKPWCLFSPYIWIIMWQTTFVPKTFLALSSNNVPISSITEFMSLSLRSSPCSCLIKILSTVSIIFCNLSSDTKFCKYSCDFSLHHYCRFFSPHHRIRLIRDLTMEKPVNRWVYCNRHEQLPIPEQLSSLPIHREFVLFMCICNFFPNPPKARHIMYIYMPSLSRR